MEWNNLTTKQRVLWVILWIATVGAVCLLGVMIYKQLTGGEITVHNWCTFTFAACSIANAYIALSQSKRTQKS